MLSCFENVLDLLLRLIAARIYHRRIPLGRPLCNVIYLNSHLELLFFFFCISLSPAVLMRFLYLSRIITWNIGWHFLIRASPLFSYVLMLRTVARIRVWQLYEVFFYFLFSLPIFFFHPQKQSESTSPWSFHRLSVLSSFKPSPKRRKLKSFLYASREKIYYKRGELLVDGTW